MTSPAQRGPDEQTGAHPGLAGVVPFRFACQRCAHCCTGGNGIVRLRPGEIQTLSTKLGISAGAFFQRYVRQLLDPRDRQPVLALREQQSEDASAGGRCVLLEGTNTCSVYEARPEQCRTFPYWPTVLSSQDAFEQARAACPGIAIVVEERVRARAFELLAALYARVDRLRERTGAADSARAACCLDPRARGELFVTAVEADHLALHTPPPSSIRAGCMAGAHRPLGCRLDVQPPLPASARESCWDELRSIERRTGYPAAYGRVAEMLAARRDTRDAGSGSDETNA